MTSNSSSTETLAQRLSALERVSSVRQLLGSFAVGSLLVVAGVVWSSDVAYAIIVIGVCAMSFSGWCAAERRLRISRGLSYADPAGQRPAVMMWTALRGVAGATGMICGVMLLMYVPFFFLGTWIS